MSEVDLLTTINSDLKVAMKAKALDKVRTLRTLISNIKNAQINARGTQNEQAINDAMILAIIEKQLKQRREAISQFESAGRDDLVQKEADEIVILSHYLPPQLTNDEIQALVKQTIAETEANSIKDMGKVMGALKPKIQGRADIKLVSEQIKSLLS